MDRQIRRILFLDVDGVLNTPRTFLELPLFTVLAVDDTIMRLLKRIVVYTECEIVLSSSWRHSDTCKNVLSDTFVLHKIPLWTSETPRGGFLDRTEEIRGWFDLQPNPVVAAMSRFAILDDLELDGFGENFFLVDAKVGLTSAIADRVIVHLNRF